MVNSRHINTYVYKRGNKKEVSLMEERLRVILNDRLDFRINKKVSVSI